MHKPHHHVKVADHGGVALPVSHTLPLVPNGVCCLCVAGTDVVAVLHDSECDNVFPLCQRLPRPVSRVTASGQCNDSQLRLYCCHVGSHSVSTDIMLYMIFIVSK